MPAWNTRILLQAFPSVDDLELNMTGELQEPLTARAGNLSEARSDLVRRCAQVRRVEDSECVAAEAEVHALAAGNRKRLR